MSFTPGPWLAFQNEGTWSGWIVRPDIGAYALATCYWQAGADGNAHYDAEANARLMAAAPDLLNACRIIRWHLDDPGEIGVKRAREILDEAIAKAIGQQTLT